MTIHGGWPVGGAAASGRAGPARRAAPKSTCFEVRDGEPGHEAAAASAADEVSLAGMLALQEARPGEVQDREARRRGQDLLAELTHLQRELLTEHGAGGAALKRLAELSRDVPPAADKRLAGIVDAIALRAAVELARRAL